MINKIREIDLKKAGFGAFLVGGVNILVHILVIIQVIPYAWVKGGC